MSYGFSFIYMGELFHAVSPWRFLSSLLGDSSVRLVTVHSRTGWDTGQLLPSTLSSAPTRGADRSFQTLFWSSSTLHPWRNPPVIVPVSKFVSLVTVPFCCSLALSISNKRSSSHPDLDWSLSDFVIALIAPMGCGVMCISDPVTTF